MIKTIDNCNGLSDIDVKDFQYQENLTSSLDNFSGDLNQNKINEIVLWKVNRYAELSDETIDLLNQIKSEDRALDVNFTEKVLASMLLTKGVRLPMASTILRFKNPHIYQIIDQRVYRFIYGKEIKHFNNIQENIALYIDYIELLRQKCDKYNIDFFYADRLLYLADKRANSKESLKGYGNAKPHDEESIEEVQ